MINVFKYLNTQYLSLSKKLIINPVYFKSKYPKEPMVRMKSVSPIMPSPGLSLNLPGI